MNLPNKLTLLRVVIIPLFLFVLCVPLPLPEVAVRLIAAALFIWAPGAVRLFSPDTDVIRYGVMFIRTNVFFLLFNCVNHVLAGSLRGRGDARGPMIIMLTSFVAIRQCYLYLVTHFVANTPRLVGFGYPVGWFSCCVLLSLYAWLKNRRRMVPPTAEAEALSEAETELTSEEA